MREVMTPEQVAEYLQLTKDTVYRLIRQHRLAATRIGRSYRIPREDVEAFMLANSTRQYVRDTYFRRVMEIGERSPQLSGDDVLDDLERRGEKHQPRRKAG